jgi:hypothetical protein
MVRTHFSTAKRKEIVETAEIGAENSAALDAVGQPGLLADDLVGRLDNIVNAGPVSSRLGSNDMNFWPSLNYLIGA